MPQPKIQTVRDKIAWVYANLACAHAAISAGRQSYQRTDYMVRTKLFNGLRSQSMKIGSIFDDERIKMISYPHCVYCGDIDNISIDHLIPRIKKGLDSGDNLVRSCKTCNSSKGAKDLLEWYAVQESFPPLLVLRRYIKLIYKYCEENAILDMDVVDVVGIPTPFRIDNLPERLPPISLLRL